MNVYFLNRRKDKVLTGHMMIEIRKWYQGKEASKTTCKRRQEDIMTATGQEKAEGRLPKLD